MYSFLFLFFIAILRFTKSVCVFNPATETLSTVIPNRD